MVAPAVVRPGRVLAPMVPPVLAVVAVGLVVWGLTRGGVWLPNLHNGVLAVAFVTVGAYVSAQRPGHREGVLFQATGVVEAVIFYGRQVGHSSSGADDSWWAWLGVWPVALGLGLTTLSVICFPDGRLPSPRWRWVVAAVVVVTVGCAAMSALWPVEYAATGTTAAPPFELAGTDRAASVWNAVAHPAYAVLQLLWVLAVVARWRRSGRLVRLQLAWLAAACGASAVFLVVGLIVWNSPRAGLLAASLVPVAAGWALVHGQHVAAVSALSWLSRTRSVTADLPGDVARAAADAVDAPGATLWAGDPGEVHAVGAWPDAAAVVDPTTVQELQGRSDRQTWPVSWEGAVVGALSVHRPAAQATTRAERALLEHLAAQAALLLAHLDLAGIADRRRTDRGLQQLSPRERDVLELMARGCSNTAIGEQLHLSVKTVEPLVGSIFTKLGLDQDAGSNRRVLAVRAFLESHGHP